MNFVENKASLVGIGLYTPSEAAQLIGVSAPKITRWLRGHSIGDKTYEPLWHSQVNLEDGHTYLGFRDLMEVRVADAFIQQGLSAHKVRRAIEVAREMIREERPLSTTRFRTDGRSVFLEVLAEDGETKLIDLFRSQFAFKKIIEPSLRNIDFEDGVPARWWPIGKGKHIVVDPERSFGQPIDDQSGVPADVLFQAVEAEGSIEAAATVWQVPVSSIKHAVEFRQRVQPQKAA